MRTRSSLAVALSVLVLAACGGDAASSASHDGGGTDADGADGGRTDALVEAGLASPDGGAPTPVSIVATADAVTITNGLSTVRFDLHTGLSDYTFGGFTPVTGAYASVDLGPSGGGYLTSKSYPAHAFAQASVETLDDGNGHGLRVPITSTAPGKPAIVQRFSVYEALPYFFVDEQVTSAAPIASSYLGAIIVDATGSVAPGAGPDPRVLDVPFDNDEWVRFDSRGLGAADFSGTGYEVGAVYESTSRHGLVVGSVTHDFWKTGFYYGATKGHLSAMNVWGGAATPDVASAFGPTYGKDGTHDVAKHGAMRGATLTSPRIFVGYFDDFRDGLEAYGRANAVVAPPKAWSGAVPFGWLSWGAYGLNVTAAKIIAASDFIAQNMHQGFGDSGPVYVNIDAGLATDPAPIVAHIHANGQKAGTYRVPFAYFYSKSDPAPLSRAAGATGFTFGDIVLADDNGNPMQHNGAYVLDVTHPGTRALMAEQIASVKSAGFDFLKLDFMTNGAMEGRHYDPNVSTGIEAYNAAMTYLASLIGPDIFVSLSIAPIFPSQYGHARRISCDVLGQLNDVMSPAFAHYGSTEYMLNALTFAWWLEGPVYPFNDPDGIALLKFEGQSGVYPAAWAQTRVTSSAIAGTVFLDTTDYADPTGAARATSLLTNVRVDALARKGRAFRPIEGNPPYVSAPIAGSSSVQAGSGATDAFVLTDGGRFFVAAFNYDASQGKSMTLDLARAGLDASKSYAVMDVWTGAPLGQATASLSVTLAAGEAKLLELQP